MVANIAILLERYQQVLNDALLILIIKMIDILKKINKQHYNAIIMTSIFKTVNDN